MKHTHARLLLLLQLTLLLLFTAVVCDYFILLLRQVYTYKRKVQCLNLPLAVLTDGGSASASEIIVGCLKDSNRAAVLGERTYGKGLAQGVSSCCFIFTVLVLCA
jgi:Peptidase family S41